MTVPVCPRPDSGPWAGKVHPTLLAPPYCHPLIAARRCPRDCRKPLPARALAPDVLLHLLAHWPGTPSKGIRLNSADQSACLHFTRACITCRASSPEAHLLIFSFIRFLTSVAVPRMRTYFGLADWEDHLQEMVLQFLARLDAYDEDRSGLSRWFHYRAVRTVQDLLADTQPGFSRPADGPEQMGALLRALNAEGTRPRSDQAWRTLAFAATGRHMKTDTIHGYLRLARPIEYLSALADIAVERAQPVVADPGDLTDEQIVEVLERDTVRDAITGLSHARRSRIAQLVGLDGRGADGRVAIATRLGISRQAVSEAIRLGTQAVKNGAGLGAFDHETVDYRDPEGPAQKEERLA